MFGLGFRVQGLGFKGVGFGHGSMLGLEYKEGRGITVWKQEIYAPVTQVRRVGSGLGLRL